MDTSPTDEKTDFYHRPGVQTTILPYGPGVPFGVEVVQNPQVGIAGAYGAWGDSYDNHSLKTMLRTLLGAALESSEVGELDELGFINRHHLPQLTDEEHLEVELEVGASLLRQAANANGWQTQDVQGVLIGMSSPITEDYLERICRRAGIPEHAWMVSIHKACDSSVAGLHLALNPSLAAAGQPNLAEELQGKKVLVGGIEGLSRFLRASQDVNALQLFGNGAGVIGVIPGESLTFLTGSTRQAYDEEGVLQVRMAYPHSRTTMLEISTAGSSHLRVAGLMHEPAGGLPIAMSGMMGMVKLFIRNGVQVVTEAYTAYRQHMERLGTPAKDVAVAIVHHANYKINKLKEKHLASAGFRFPMPWLLNDFGNVSAASNMIAFLRWLPNLKPGEHILFDGFGAGTYYDSLTVALAD
jgi:3-oxoacyl-[acyl-carrier-protein] synthase III